MGPYKDPTRTLCQNGAECKDNEKLPSDVVLCHTQDIPFLREEGLPLRRGI